MRRFLPLWLALTCAATRLLSQNSSPRPNTPDPPAATPLPSVTTLLSDVERHQKQLEALQRDYTYHVHTDEQELNKDKSVKKTETEDAESLTVDGIRVNRVVARNGKPLTPDEQRKENERIDKDVAKAKERRAKFAGEGKDTDDRGDTVLPLSRILELGSFSNPRRTEENGRSLIIVDYTGNPQAKTHSAFEGIMKDVAGTLWIDESDRVLVRAGGHFLNDFKLAGGLMADVRKDSNFSFTAVHVADGIWLPATIDGQGSVRLLLFAHFNGRLHLTTSDYRRFRTSATIVGSHGAIGPDGTPIAGTAPPQAGTPSANPQ